MWIVSDAQEEKAEKELEMRQAWIQELKHTKEFVVQFVPTDRNLADALTKLLPNVPKFRWAASRLHSWTMAL